MKKIKKNISPNKAFGQRLRAARKEAGLSQVEFAEKLGYKRNVSISNIESGRTPPSAPILAKTADILKVDLHWLITGKSSPEALKCEEDLKAAIYKISAYVSRSLADYIDLKITRQKELDEELQKQARGEAVEADFIDSLRSEIAWYERELSGLNKDLPWLEQAAKFYECAAAAVKMGKPKKK